jgi:hypothetical protein
MTIFWNTGSGTTRSIIVRTASTMIDFHSRNNREYGLETNGAKLGISRITTT